jgi:hypothetical protein
MPKLNVRLGGHHKFWVHRNDLVWTAISDEFLDAGQHLLEGDSVYADPQYE